MNRILVLFLLISGMLYSQDNQFIKEVLEHQETLNKQFITKGKSPLTEEDRKHFNGLDFFDIDLKYRVEAKITKIENAETIMVKSSSGRTKFLIPYIKLSFTMEGKDLELTAYQSPSLVSKPEYEDYLFLPFTDLSNGDTTYEVGRFIDLEIPLGKTMIIDFNKAYNPYCAYSDGWNCTIPPKENHINVTINAGVKKYKDH